jgi:hypothetical protein
MQPVDLKVIRFFSKSMAQVLLMPWGPVYFENGKAVEKQRRKATDLTPLGHDCRVAESYWYILFSAPLGIRAKGRFFF